MLGDVLKAYRDAKGWSQRDLAARSNLPQSYISLLERGKRRGTIETYQVLARAFGVPLEELIRATGEDLPVRLEPSSGGDAIPPAALDALARLAPLLSARGWELLLVYAEGLAADRAARLDPDLQAAMQEALAADLVYFRLKPHVPAPN